MSQRESNVDVASSAAVRRGNGPLLATVLAIALFVGACRPAGGALPPVANESPTACEARKRDFAAFVESLPDHAVRIDVSVELPISTLGVPPGWGRVLEVTETSLRLDGAPIERAALGERLGSEKGTLYVAAAPDVTIRSLRALLAPLPKELEPKLLVRTERSAGAFLAVPGLGERSRELAEAVIAERDPAERRALARRAYAELADCAAFGESLSGVEGLGSGDRFPALKRAMVGAVPRCPCASLDTAGLRAMLFAEQRAGTAALGSLPLAFVRDERCGASMPLRSVKRLLEQVESFDSEFAGAYREDAIRFEQVVTNERLLVQFCDALPGETLAALGKARATLWMKLPGGGACEGWTLEPLSPGAPMGTLRRTKPAGAEPLAFHYWQAAEEVSVYGPVSPENPTKPTDRREWDCRVDARLAGIEPEWIVLEKGRWFFNETACRNAPADAARDGCVAQHASGARSATSAASAEGAPASPTGASPPAAPAPGAKPKAASAAGRAK